MKKTMILACLIMACCALSCANNDKKSDEKTAEQSEVKNVSTEVNLPEGMDVPPVLAIYVSELPLFAPFNEGDLMNGGKVLKETPEKYTKFILGERVFDVTYKEEKNKELEHDGSYYNQYIYHTKDEMKGQLFSLANEKVVEAYLYSIGHFVIGCGDASAGEGFEFAYDDGILVSADYMKGRTVMKTMATKTEGPTEPQFSSNVISQVEKMVGAKVESNRIAYIFGDNEYSFGVMKTKPNDKYALAVWVLSKGNDVSIATDTCEVEGGQVYWSNYDPDEYLEPSVLTVVKGKNDLDIYCNHASTDETMNYMLMRQEGKVMRKFDMGGFYQMYE